MRFHVTEIAVLHGMKYTWQLIYFSQFETISAIMTIFMFYAILANENV